MPLTVWAYFCVVLADMVVAAVLAVLAPKTQNHSDSSTCHGLPYHSHVHNTTSQKSGVS